MTDTFDVQQHSGESLKEYLTWLNGVVTRVTNPNERMIVPTFCKGFRARLFEESLIEYLIKTGPLANYARKEKDQQDDMSWDIKEKRDPPPPPNTRNTTTPTHQQRRLAWIMVPTSLGSLSSLRQIWGC
ncbi:hypothetical protein JHK87_009916 [Glycine soja]|nr:hypothetical protein JHK87_009916 [Glycine soja]